MIEKHVNALQNSWKVIPKCPQFCPNPKFSFFRKKDYQILKCTITCLCIIVLLKEREYC